MSQPAPKRLGEAGVPHNLIGLQQLAAAGEWRALASLSQKLLATSQPVEQLMHYRWHRIAALLHLPPEPSEARSHAAQAAKELAALGDLTGPSWLYERHASVYPGRTGSMVPFGLLLLHALVPAYNEEHMEATRRLYALQTLLESAPWPRSATAPAEGAEARVREQRQQEQRQQVSLALANVYCAHADYPLAIVHLEAMLKDAGADPKAAARAAAPLLSLLGRVHLQAT